MTLMSSSFSLGGTIRAWSLAILLGVSLQSFGSAPRKVLQDEFNSRDMPIAIWSDGPRKLIEVCTGDWCQLVESRAAQENQDATWEALFLLAYFFDLSDERKAKLTPVAQDLVAKYANNCGRELDRATASCILAAIQRAHDLSYRRVQYDINSRCVSTFVPREPYFLPDGHCKPIKASRFRS